MEIKKPNDIFVSIIDNPQATTYDLMSNGFNGENTSLYSKDEYKQSKFIQETFKTEDGKFDDQRFNQAYELAQQKYVSVTDKEYVDKFTKELDQMEYSPFDITRPKFAKTFNVSATFQQDSNPFKQLKGWTGMGSIDDNPLSLREIAQQSKVFDPLTNTWSEKSLNDLNIFDKIFGDTLVYAQYDEDTEVFDPNTGQKVMKRKGDWKVNDNGEIYTEKLAGREVFGKQVVNPMDVLTTDGSIIDQYNFLDSDGREKSIVGTTMKLATEIAPFFIPAAWGATAMKIPKIYGGIKAALGLASTLPTFYKSLEGMLIGDNETTLTKGATALEGYFAKYTEKSFSDESKDSLFNYEQLGTMVTDTFTQLYEQRAMASLSKVFHGADKIENAKALELGQKITKELGDDLLKGKIDFADFQRLQKAAMSKIPELESVIASQGKTAKALSLGYMALTSTADIYGEALASGYDRRTAGFAALASAAGQYGIMMNNKMGDWFLDKTTGYNVETNKLAMKSALKPWLKEIQEGFQKTATDKKAGKAMLGETLKKIKGSLDDVFLSGSPIIESMWKSSLVEGVEEVTEQAVQDATKGIIDTMNYLGLAGNQEGKKGSFGGWSNVFSQKGFENYLSNFVGGALGGAMFSLNEAKIQPWLNPNDALKPDTKKNVYELVAGGHKDELIKMIDSKKSSFGNTAISFFNNNGDFTTSDKSISQADLIANQAKDMINWIDGVINAHDLGKSDEEIVRKAIRDDLVIQKMMKAKPEGSALGLEGLVLEDYKTRMSKVVDLEAKLKDAEEGSKQEKALKQEIKTITEDINNIMDGKKSSEYLGKMEFYLNDKINSAFMLADRNAYAFKTYGVNYSDLASSSEVGDFAISKERIDNEWKSFIDKKDLRKSLDVAYNVYTKLEKDINKSLADYSETGYDVETKKTRQNLIDIQATLHAYNTTVDVAEKERLFQRFSLLSNELQERTGKILLPQDVMHHDLVEKLFNLNLIKKSEFVNNVDGTVTVNNVDFTNDELDANKHENLKKKDWIRTILNTALSEHPLNPLDLETNLKIINEKIDKTNSKTIAQINQLESEPTRTPEQEEELKQLKESLIDFKVFGMDFSNILDTARSELDTNVGLAYANNGTTKEDMEKYLYKKSDEKALDSLIDQIKVIQALRTEISDIATLPEKTDDEKNKLKKDRGLELFKLLNTLEATLANSAFYDDVLAGSSLTADEFNKLFEDIEEKKGKDEESVSHKITDDILSTFDNFINLSFKAFNDIKTDLNSDKYSKTETELKEARATFEETKNALLPDIFKFGNYALTLITKELNSGNLDKEIFETGKKMYNEGVAELMVKILPTNPTLPFEELLELESKLKLVIDNINANVDEDIDADDEHSGKFGWSHSISYYLTLKSVSDEDKEVIRKLNILNESIDDLDNLSKNISNLINKHKSEIKQLKDFNDIASKGVTLKSNPLYDFLRNFVITLNSGKENNVSKIIDILQREESILSSSSNVNSFTSDDIRDSDINQAIEALEMIKSVVYAMTTTQVGYDDPFGFIAARQNFAKKYNLDDDVKNLKTITSDIATLMNQDLDMIISKLRFLNELAGFNAGKFLIEQELIRGKISKILVDKWKDMLSKISPSFLPIEKIKGIINGEGSNEEKLIQIETLIFDHNIDQKPEAIEEFKKVLTNPKHTEIETIDKDIKSLSEYQFLVYFGTVLGSRSQDWTLRIKNSLDSGFDKAPFFAQEWAARTVKASLEYPELFDKISNNWLTLLYGNAGSGKSTAALGILVDNIRQTNEKSEIWLSAPNTNRVKGLSKSLKESVGTDKLTTTELDRMQLYEKLGIKDLMETLLGELKDIGNTSNKYIKLTDKNKVAWNNFSEIESVLDSINYANLPNFLVIDEITHFSMFEGQILSEISKRSYKNGFNFMKVLGLGDNSQRGFRTVKKDEVLGDSYLDYSISKLKAIYTPRLFASIRSQNTQKRKNNDTYSRVSQKIVSIYSDANLTSGEKWKEVGQTKALEYLTSIKDDIKLSYYHNVDPSKGSIDFNGDKIVSDFSHIEGTLKTVLKEKSDAIVGIITKDGNPTPEYLEILNRMGLIDGEGNHPRVKFYSIDNIQGDEMEYVIFDVDLLSGYDVLRDVFESFYTFITRSMKGTVIIDKNDLLGGYNIVNEDKADNYTREFTKLNTKSISEAKEQKKNDIINMLGAGTKVSDKDNFKWKVGEKGATLKDDEDYDESKEGSASVYHETGKTDKEITESLNSSDEDKDSKESETSTKPKDPKKASSEEPSDFRAMFHSFYNSPGVKLDADLKIKELKYDITNPKSDLNIPGLNTSEEAEINKYIKEWTELKSYLLGKLDSKISYISGGAFPILKTIFGNTENNKIEFVTTVQKFNEEIHTPYQKKGFDKTKLLKNGNPFINISAKITSASNQVHYITLATLGTEAQLLDKSPSGLQDKITEFFKDINKLIATTTGIIDLNTVESGNVKWARKTWLNRKITGEKYKLSDLEEQFPGAYFSEIQMFPRDLGEFKALFRKFTFGTERTDAQLDKMFNVLKGKPYIVGTYTKEHLNGHSGNFTDGVLIPVSNDSRNFDTMVSEVTKNFNERTDPNKKDKDFDFLNTEQETLLHRRDMIQMLYILAKTKNDKNDKRESILDVLSTTMIKRGDKKVSLLDLLSRREKTDSYVTNMKEVIKNIQKLADKSGSSATLKGDDLNAAIKSIEGIKGWYFIFGNIFNLGSTVTSISDANFAKLYSRGVFDSVDEISDYFKEEKDKAEKVAEILNSAYKSIKAAKPNDYYYSIPVAPKGTSLIVNPHVAKRGGVSHDKFFIDKPIESGRLLLDLDMVLSISKGKTPPPPDPTFDEIPENRSIPTISSHSDIKLGMMFFKDSIEYKVTKVSATEVKLENEFSDVADIILTPDELITELNLGTIKATNPATEYAYKVWKVFRDMGTGLATNMIERIKKDGSFLFTKSKPINMIKANPDVYNFETNADGSITVIGVFDPSISEWVGVAPTEETEETEDESKSKLDTFVDFLMKGFTVDGKKPDRDKDSIPYFEKVKLLQEFFLILRNTKSEWGSTFDYELFNKFLETIDEDVLKGELNAMAVDHIIAVISNGILKRGGTYGYLELTGDDEIIDMFTEYKSNLDCI